MNILYAWPAAARVESRIPRDRLFRAAGGGKAIRALYDEQVEKIDWAFKLFERSVNLPPASGVDEVEVFRITLRSGTIDDRILAHIDKAIPQPILFELVRAAPDGDEVQMAAAYKRRSDADKSQVVMAAKHSQLRTIQSSFLEKPRPQRKRGYTSFRWIRTLRLGSRTKTRIQGDHGYHQISQPKAIDLTKCIRLPRPRALCFHRPMDDVGRIPKKLTCVC